MRPTAAENRENVPKRKRNRKKTSAANKPLAKNKSSQDVIAKMKNRLGIICPICLDHLHKGEVSSTTCGHIFCTSCIKKALRANKCCPTCRRWLGFRAYHPLYLDDCINAPIDEIVSL